MDIVLNQKNLVPIITVELLQLKENKVLMGSIETKRLIGWLKVKSAFHLLFEKVVPFLLDFTITWVVEAGFSAANGVLTKKCNLLQMAKTYT